MAIPAFRAAGALSAGAGALADVAAPAGLAADDVELMPVFSSNQAASLSTAAGFAELFASTGQGTPGADGAVMLTIFWRRWNGSDGAPTVADSGQKNMARRLAFSGCRTGGDPWDAVGENQQTSATTSGSATGVTSLTNDCLIVYFSAQPGPDAAGPGEYSAWANAGLSGVAELIDDRWTVAGGEAFGVAAGGLASAGAAGTMTFTTATSLIKDNVCLALASLAAGSASADSRHMPRGLARGLARGLVTQMQKVNGLYRPVNLGLSLAGAR